MLHTLQNTSECHQVPRLRRETKHRDAGNLQKLGTAIRPRADGCERLRTVADGCGRLRTVANGRGRKRNVEGTHPSTPRPPE